MSLIKKLYSAKKSINRAFTRVMNKLRPGSKNAKSIVPLQFTILSKSVDSIGGPNIPPIPMTFDPKWIRRSIVICALMEPIHRARRIRELAALSELKPVTCRSPFINMTIEEHLAHRLNPYAANCTWEQISAKNQKAVQEEITELTSMKLVTCRPFDATRMESHLFMGLSPSNATRFYNLVAVRRLMSVNEELAQLRRMRLVTSLKERPTKTYMLHSISWIFQDGAVEEDPPRKMSDETVIAIKKRQDELICQMLKYY